MSSHLLAEAVSLGSRASSPTEFLLEGCGLLRRAIGADALLGISQEDRTWTAEHAQGVAPEIMQRLTAGWTIYGRELRRVFQVAHGAGAAVDVHVLGASLERSAYYREIMYPQGAKAGAIVMLTRRESVLGAFVLGRRSGFSKGEERRLSEVAPALGLGLAALRASATHSSPRASVASSVPNVRGSARPWSSSCPTPTEQLGSGFPWKLSRREREFVEYVCLGYTNKEIALACGISPNTVRNRLAAVYERLGVSTRAELASLVSRRGGSSRWYGSSYG
jgi:DNA-binding NarL/FixJ family response regulator